MGARGVIAAIKPHPSRRKHYQVAIDGHDDLILHEDVIVACNLTTGDRVTDEVLERIDAEKQVHTALQAALRRLDYRARSRHELHNALQQKGFHEPIIQQVLAKLDRAGLIDDRSFARERVRSLLKRNIGAKGLVHRLRQHGVDEQTARQVVAEELNGVDETERAITALQQKLQKWNDLAPNKRRARAYRYLARLGFDEDAISNTLAKALPDNWE